MKRLIGYVRMKIERRARWDVNWRPVDNLLQKLETIYWHMRGYHVVECLGDSHVKVFRRLNWIDGRLKYRFRTISVMGATAYSLGKLNSRTSARSIFQRRLDGMPRDHLVLIMLGEIDAGYLIWYLAKERGSEEKQILQKSVDSYIEFIRNLKMQDRDVIVCSAPLPTIHDAAEIPEYMAERRAINVGQVERTLMTLEFNRKIHEACVVLGVKYLDLDSVSLDEETGLVKKELINHIVLDHHYNEGAFSRVIYGKWIYDFMTKFERSALG